MGKASCSVEPSWWGRQVVEGVRLTSCLPHGGRWLGVAETDEAPSSELPGAGLSRAVLFDRAFILHPAASQINPRAVDGGRGVVERRFLGRATVESLSTGSGFRKNSRNLVEISIDKP